MANYANLTAAITAAIKTNGVQSITGQSLQTVLLQMVTAMGQAGALFGGVVGTADSPASSDSNLYYLAAEAGTYANFNNAVVSGGELVVFTYTNGAWGANTIYSAGTPVVNDLTTGGTTSALSAAMGKVLGDLLGAQITVTNNPNIFNKATVVSGYYLNPKVASPTANANFWYSQKISVTPGKIIMYNDKNLRYYFHMYDSSQNFIAATNANNNLWLLTPSSLQNSTWSYFTVPAGVYYMEFSAQNTYLNTAVYIMVDNTSEIANYDFSTYYPYGTTSTISSNELDTINAKLAAITSPLSEKKIIVIGDSMVYGNTLGTSVAWPAQLANTLGTTYEVSSTGQSALTEDVLINAGVNGCMLSNNNAPFNTNIADAVINRYSSMDTDADYVIVFAGTNDAWAFYRGEISLGDDDSVDDTTFNGAMNVLIQGLLTQYPKGKIAFITPYDDGSTERESIITAMKAACVRNGGIPCYDNGTLGGIDWDNAAQAAALTQDSTHLSADGHKWVVTKYKSFFESL